MKKDNSQKIGDIINKLMKNPKLSIKLDKIDAIEAWQEIIGKPLHKYIKEQKIYKGILYVKIKSSVVWNELSYEKSKLIKKINDKIGKDIISDIILR